MKILSQISKRIIDIHIRSRRPASRIPHNPLLPINLIAQFMMPPAPHPLTEEQKQLKTFQCPFCQRPCLTSNHYKFRPDSELKGWKCTNHLYTVQFVAIPSGDYYGFYFSTLHNQQEYSIEAYKLPDGEQWQLRRGSEVVINLQKIPWHITPESIDGRIQSLLLFS